MAKRETLEQFAKNLHKFSPLIQQRILKNWQTYTGETFAQSQDEFPILTGALLRSGSVRNAKITSNGIESSIVYNLPYAQRIHDGDEEGNLELKPVGFRYSHATKAREGEFLYLEEPARIQRDQALKDIKKSIGEAWALI